MGNFVCKCRLSIEANSGSRTRAENKQEKSREKISKNYAAKPAFSDFLQAFLGCSL
jgi:hypothetical protein